MNDAGTGVRYGFQTLSRDFLLALLAAAERSLLDAGQGCVDLLHKMLLVLQQGQRDLLLVSVRAKVCQMQRHVREPATGFAADRTQDLLLQRGKLAAITFLQSQQTLAVNFKP